MSNFVEYCGSLPALISLLVDGLMFVLLVVRAQDGGAWFAVVCPMIAHGRLGVLPTEVE